MNVAVISNGNAFSTMMLRGLIGSTGVDGIPGVQITGAVVVSVPPGPGGSAGRLWRLARRTGWRYAAFKGWSKAVPALAGIGSPRHTTLASALRAVSIPVVNARSANGDRATGFLRDLRPDVVLSVSSPERFEDAVLEIPSVAAINVHWAELPAYGGIAPYFWMLRNGEPQAGVTVHRMVPELDAGPILLQRRVPIEPSDTVLSLQLRLARAGSLALREAVAALPGSLTSATAQDRTSRSYFTWPTPADVRALRASGRRLARPRDLIALARASRSKMDP